MMVALIAAAGIAARADVPASAVYTHSVGPGQAYPGVDAHSEGWFDVGGFCKVVDVGDLSTLAPNAHGVPVFVPGPANQWENYRSQAPSHYSGQLVLTTCCRPQANIASLCTEAGATLVSVNRQYGKNGETDEVTATCTDQWGRTYTDSVAVTCTGDNGPDGQAQWVETGSDATSNCTADAYDTGCSAACDNSSTGTRYDSCGVPTNYTCYGPPCPPPPPPPSGGGTTPTGSSPSPCTESCQVGSNTEFIVDADDCDWTFPDCALSSWTLSGGTNPTNCTSIPQTVTVTIICPTGPPKSTTNTVVSGANCTCTN